MLKRHRQKPKSEEFKPLSGIKTVGMVYDVEALSWKTMTQIIRFFESHGKSVTTLGYLDEKELNHNYTPNYKHMFFCKEQVNFWRLPQPATLERFLGTPFDYLINLDVEGSLVLQAVSTYSTAKARIGLYQEPFQFCQDFMIKCEASNGVELIENLKNYIKK